MTTDKVKVAVRVRPLSRREIELGTQCIVAMKGCQTVVYHPHSAKGHGRRKQPKTFAFDHCFWSFNKDGPCYANQAAVFQCLGADILDNAFLGYNACIFAYGQTGSGKSFTMMGSENNKGLIPRLCDALFERIASNKDPSNSYKVEVSYMEIYNEKVHDLLDPKGTNQNLKVREHNILGPYVDGLSTLAVSSFEEINSLILEGNKSRTVAATNMNNESSRSHAVFNIILSCSIKDTELGVTGEKVSKMSLVDLAGSERAVKSGAVGERLKEGANINKSLTTLGLVISKLADHSSSKAKDKFVPYRDSVLTWLLKDNIGGNSKTVMLATISPAADNYDETLSTLRYADRAKKIVNHAVINEDPNARIIRELRKEVEQLREQLKHATKQEDLCERLMESEKLMKEMSRSWEEKLSRTEQVHQEHQQALEKMGISVQTSGIRVENDKHYLVNLNADPSLNELLVYYLKDQTLVGRPDAPVEQDIQLLGLGIMPEHCIITVEYLDVFIIPRDGARTCVNGSVVTCRTQLKHGDRVLWGNNHFFRVNCPKATTPCTPDISGRPIDYEFAREELMMKELSNDPIQSAMKALERQHEEDKHNALEKQRQVYERQLQMLRNQMSPTTPYAPYFPFDPFSFGRITPTGSCISVQSRMERWAKERDELFKKSLAKLRQDIIKANTLVREANFLAEEMGKETAFKVTLQIPAANLSPNRKRGAFVSEPAILVKRKNRWKQVWSTEKLENKLIDMREIYEERKEEGLSLKDDDQDKNKDPFYETQENHHLIGVANVFLEVLFHNVELDYHIPIISQQGEVAGRLHVGIERIAGIIPDRLSDSCSSEGSILDRESLRGSLIDVSSHSEEVNDPVLTKQAVIKVAIKSAIGLPPSLANLVFCQYTFWNHHEAILVAPVVIPEYSASRKSRDRTTFRFDHTKEFLVNVTEEFVEHCTEGALSIEVWGHRGSAFTIPRPGWIAEAQLQRSRSLIDRWAELTRKLEFWVEIQELNEQGDYSPVEVIPKPDSSCGGVYQLKQGQQRRILVMVRSVQNSGTLPFICETITSIAVGCVCSRSKLQKPLDSYQEEDLILLRDRWSEALVRRREYLDDQMQKVICKKDEEREQSLIDQWVSLTEERNAVLVPAPGSGIPGAPAEWDPPLGMEKHIPVIFLDLNADDLSITGDTCGGVPVAGANSILPKEHGSKMFNLPIIKYSDKDLSAVSVWDSSIHDSIHLNRVTPQNERVYLILKASVRLSHPATMDILLRKRLALNVYKKQSIVERMRKRIARQECIYGTGVMYEVVSNIPKASEDPEDRESLALMAASGEDVATNDGESYIEKYTRGVSAVESILTLDRLRQEVAVKELLTLQRRFLRKTLSVPNIGHIMRRDSSYKLDDILRSDSTSDHLLPDTYRQRPTSLRDSGSDSKRWSTSVGNVSQENPFILARPTFLNLSFNLNLWQGSSSKSSPLSGMSPQPKKLVKPMSTLLEEQTNRDLHLIRGQELLEEASDGLEESDGTSEKQSQEEIRNKLELAELESNNRKINNRCLRNSDPNLKDKIGFTERNLKHSATQDSLTELQIQAKTPSALSSGYGSQVLSTTPVSSEDSMSIRSLSAEDLTSSEPNRSMLRNPDDLNVQSEDKMDGACCTESQPTLEKVTQIKMGISPAQLEELSKCCHISHLETQDQKTNNNTEENMWNVGRYSDFYNKQTGESRGDISKILQTAADVVGNINSKAYCDKEGTENIRQTTCIKEKTNNKCESFLLQKSDDAIGETIDIEKKNIGCENKISENTSIEQNVIETSVIVNNSADRRSSIRLRMKKSKQVNPSYRASYPGGTPSLKIDCQQDDISGSSIPEENVSSFLGEEDSSSLSSSISHPSLKDSAGIHIPSVGETVVISPHNKTGVVAFVGQTEFASGIWAGIVLDTPSGKNDGSLNGVQYFQCKPCFGIFVRPEKLTLCKRRRTSGSSDRLVRSSSSDEGFLVGKFSSRRRSCDENHSLSAKGYSFNFQQGCSRKDSSTKRKHVSEEPAAGSLRSYSGTEGVGVSLTRKQICRSRYYKGNQ